LNIDWNIAAALKACWPTFAKILSGLIRGRVFEEVLARSRLQKTHSAEKFSGAKVTNAIAGPS
jgi:hypothetical protein